MDVTIEDDGLLGGPGAVSLVRTGHWLRVSFPDNAEADLIMGGVAGANRGRGFWLVPAEKIEQTRDAVEAIRQVFEVDPPEVPETLISSSIEQYGRWFVFRSENIPNIRLMMKRIGGAFWNPHQRAWLIPTEQVAALETFMRELPNIRALAREEAETTKLLTDKKYQAKVQANTNRRQRMLKLNKDFRTNLWSVEIKGEVLQAGSVLALLYHLNNDALRHRAVAWGEYEFQSVTAAIAWESPAGVYLPFRTTWPDDNVALVEALGGVWVERAFVTPYRTSETPAYSLQRAEKFTGYVFTSRLIGVFAAAHLLPDPLDVENQERFAKAWRIVEQVSPQLALPTLYLTDRAMSLDERLAHARQLARTVEMEDREHAGGDAHGANQGQRRLLGPEKTARFAAFQESLAPQQSARNAAMVAEMRRQRVQNPVGSGDETPERARDDQDAPTGTNVAT